MALARAEWREAAPGRAGEHGPDRPIDRDHLSRMTLGDEDLRREVLQLFVRQVATLVARMDPSRPPAVAALAHTLLGSASSVGAGPLAAAALRVEAAAKAASEDLAPALAALRACAEQTSGAILPLLRSP